MKNEEWKNVKLEDLCDELSDGLHKAPVFVENGEYIFVNAKNLAKGYIVDPDKSKHTSYEEYLKYKIDLNERTILYSIDGTIGNIARYRGEKCVLGKGACYINLKKDIFADFIYYQLQSPHFNRYINHLTTGSTIGHISLKTMRNYTFSLPPLAEQQRIAKILSALDDKIELNNAINRKLEEQAKAIFNSVYDKAVNQVPFTSIISIASGGTPKTSESSFWNGNIPFFTPKDVGIPFTLNTEKYITDEGLNNCNSRLYPTNTTFITARGTVGKLSLAAKPMAMNQSCFALVSERINPILIYMYAIRAVDSLKKKSNGAVFDAITIKDFETERVNKLSDEEIKPLSSVIEPIYSQIRLNTIENHRLSDLRDSLLPKLMSGDLGV